MTKLHEMKSIALHHNQLSYLQRITIHSIFTWTRALRLMMKSSITE